jgi:hypothetical protein
MSCEGCCTFSDHREVNGIVDLEASKAAIKFWSEHIMPGRVLLFGGEPTMNPQLLEWFQYARECFPKTKDGFPMPIWLNTNGYFLDKLFPYINELFVDATMFISVTHHTTTEPYASLVLQNYATLKQMILEAWQQARPGENIRWEMGTPWDSDHKKFSILKTDTTNFVILNMTFQHGDHFVSHYRGKGPTLKPWHDYKDTEALVENHRDCHIKNYMQVYNGRLYKCPPRAVLNQTLETYNLQNDPDWAPYYNDYQSLGMDASEQQIADWFERWAGPENSCNMCGFKYSDNTILPAQQHLPKKMFKLKPV